MPSALKFKQDFDKLISRGTYLKYQGLAREGRRGERWELKAQLNVSNKNHCGPRIAVWLRPSTSEPCIWCVKVAGKPRGEQLNRMYVCMSEEGRKGKKKRYKERMEERRRSDSRAVITLILTEEKMMQSKPPTIPVSSSPCPGASYSYGDVLSLASKSMYLQMHKIMTKMM